MSRLALAYLIILLLVVVVATIVVLTSRYYRYQRQLRRGRASHHKPVKRPFWLR